MKKWKAIDDHVLLGHVIHLRRTPARMDLIAVRMLGELRRAGCTSRVEAGRDRIAFPLTCENQSIVWLCFDCIVEGHDLVTYIASHGNDVLQARAVLADVRDLRPDVEIRMRSKRHQHLRLRGIDQVRNVMRTKEEVDRADAASRLPAQQGDVSLGNAGQEKGDCVFLFDPERSEQIGRLPHLCEQLAVGQTSRVEPRLPPSQESQCVSIGKQRGRVLDNLVDIPERDDLVIRMPLDSVDVGA